MRERVIGAIVLIVIAAIMVPWLMSNAHHPREHLRDLALAAAPTASVPPALALPPATGAGAGAGQAPLVAGATGSGPSPASSVLAQTSMPKQTPLQPSAQPPPKQTALRTAARTPALEQMPAQEPSAPAKSSRRIAKEAAPPPATRAPGVVQQSASPPSSVATRTAPASEPQLGQGILHQGDWYVQVASFASHANAAQMAILLTRAGYHAFLSTHESGGTLLYRVRVGPYPNETRARAVAPGLAAVSGAKVLVRQATGGDG